MRNWMTCAVSFAFVLVAPATTDAQDRDTGATSEDSASETSGERMLLAQNEGTSDDTGGGDAQQSQSSEGQLQRSDQMEFDARLIRGERASGAVFLFQRTPRKLPSMVERRRSYLEGSVRSTLGDDWAESFNKQRTRADREAGTDAEDSDEEVEGDIIDRLDEERQSDD